MDLTRRITCLTIALSPLATVPATVPIAKDSYAENVDNLDSIPYQSFIKDTISEVEFLLEDDTDLPISNQIKIIEDVWKKRFATRLITRFVLGKYSRKAEETDIERFEKAFIQVNSFSLIERLKSIKEKSYSFGQAHKMKSSTVLVSTEFIMSNGKKMNIGWRVVAKNGVYKIVDIVIADISMIQTFRNEYNAYLKGSKGDINALIIDLEKQLVKIKSISN